ncbi:MAG: BREX-2 system phosphatase PglZ [Acidobacteria bacterium]|nr:BREX-2 system phosphatase PglZ [Acidobacteriota bacterium]
MTSALLEVTVKQALERRKNPSHAIGIHSATPPDCELVHGLRVAWCRSMLEMREQLSSGEPGKLVIVTPLERLADDLCARLHKRDLLRVDIWEVLRQRYGARGIEGRLRADRVVGEALLRCSSNAAIPTGVLYEDAAWLVIATEIFELPSARPDPVDLLRWVAEPAGERLAASPPELRERLGAWLKRSSGPIAATLLGVAVAGHGRDAIAIGLALRALLAEAGNPDLAQSLARIERYTANQPLPRETAEAWAAAAEKLVSAEQVEASDRILNDVGAARFAYLSRWSASGNQQCIDEFAAALAPLPSNTATLERLITELRERNWAGGEGPILDRLEMSIRLLRWRNAADPALTDFEDSAFWYAQEGSWVDWARTRIRGGYERGPLAAALASLTAAVKERRERLNRRFAELLAAWNNQGANFQKLAGVESVIERYIVPLACRELCVELAARRWTACSADAMEIPPVVSALPSVTEFSRYSLLSGALARGNQGAEESAWSLHPGLTAASPKQHPPILFHKDDLAAMAGPDSPVLSEIANTKRRVVGVVINAIDDSLSGPVQIAPDWDLDYLAVLRPLLDEAAAAGRVVVLTADHGHILDFGTECRRQEGSDRYRSGKAGAGDEHYLEGGRVIGSIGVTTLGVEGIRYSPRPRNGYHGGITPQECLVPVMVFVQAGRAVPGWQEVVESQPEWWLAGAPTPARESKVKRKAKQQPTLFGDDWISNLLASDLFRQQMDIPGNRIQPERLAAVLRALDASGNRLLRTAFASRMSLPLVRVNTTVAAMQRVLNYDGYGILTIDEAADMVVLDRSLLQRQFNL